MRINNKKNKEQGATLIEVMMVVALFAIIAIGSLIYYQSASQGTKVQQTVTGLASMTSVIRNQFASQGHYNGISETIVARFGNVPKQMRLDDTDNLIHAWNNSSTALNIGPVTGTGTATTPSHFYIQLVNVPARVCMDMVTKMYKNFSVTVGATAPTTTTGGISTIAAANTSCGTGGESDNVTLNFLTQ